MAVLNNNNTRDTNDSGIRTAGQQGSSPPQVPQIGQIVHYVLSSGEHAGEHRPAIVVRVFGDQPTSAVNLQVFTDGKNDGLIEHYDEGVVHVASATYAEPDPIVLRSYHFPEDTSKVARAAEDNSSKNAKAAEDSNKSTRTVPATDGTRNVPEESPLRNYHFSEDSTKDATGAWPSAGATGAPGDNGPTR